MMRWQWRKWYEEAAGEVVRGEKTAQNRHFADVFV